MWLVAAAFICAGAASPRARYLPAPLPFAIAHSSQAQGAPATLGLDAAALVRTYCVTCHNDRLKTGGLSLQALDLAERAGTRGGLGEGGAETAIGRDAAARPSARGPTRASRARSRRIWKRRSIARRPSHPNPGPRADPSAEPRRVQQRHPRSAGGRCPPGEWLPVDDSGYGFDNIAAVLSTSPALLDRYMSAARKVSRLRSAISTLKPVEEIYDAKRDPVKGARNEQLNDDLPFDSRAGMTVAHYFPLDAEYVFKIRVPRRAAGDEAAMPIRIRSASR